MQYLSWDSLLWKLYEPIVCRKIFFMGIWQYLQKAYLMKGNLIELENEE